jgi:uncharacterized protein (DUF305 family)
MVSSPRTALLGVALVMAGALGVSLTHRHEGPPAYPTTTSAEATFAREMQNHHSQAVEMAVITRDRTPDRQIRAFASDLALDQQGEIGQLRALLDVWGLAPVDAAASDHMPGDGMLSQADVDALNTAPRNEVGTRFLQLMIPHHEAGVAMANTVLATTHDRVVRDLAYSIVRVQHDEIELMRELLRARGVNQTDG